MATKKKNIVSEKTQEKKPEVKNIMPEKVQEKKPEPIKTEVKKSVPENSQHTYAMKVRAKEVFKSHDETVKEVYFTADGQCFIQPQFARIHNEFLKNETIVTIKRTEV